MRELVCIFLACFMLASCELETSGNGDLDGFWQLRSVDSLLNKEPPIDMKSQQVFWAFQVNMLQTTQVGNRIVNFRFQRSGDYLILTSPHDNNREDDDPPITDVSLLQPLGINNLEEHFKILELDGSKMTLQSSTLRLYFRKY